MALKDRKGVVTNYTYDKMNRMLNKTATVSDNETEFVTYTYDTLGNVSTMVDETGTTRYTYNDYNLLSSIITPDNNSISYSYNNLKQLAGVLNYDDEYISYTYDLLGNVKSITKDNIVMADYIYNDFNALSYITYLNREGDDVYVDQGAVSLEYDSYMRLTDYTNILDDSAMSLKYEYTYDSSGNQIRKKEIVDQVGTVLTEKVTNYTYDAANRLSSYTAPDGTVTTYTFDTRNNITRESITHPQDYIFGVWGYEDTYYEIDDVVSHTIDYTYNNANQLILETETVSGTSLTDNPSPFVGSNIYTYDLNGNLTGKTRNGDYDQSEIKSFEFDAFNRLKKVNVVTWIYDSEPYSVVLDYVYKYNGNNELSEIVNYQDYSYNSSQKYYWDRSYIVKDNSSTYYLGVDGVFAQDSGTDLTYLFKNGHGDTVRLVRNGSMIDSADYDPYGNYTDWNSYSSYGYANYYYDSNSGFYYLRNRFYDPSIGRFVSEDPIQDGINWYAYCGGNPIAFVDPLGLDAIVANQTENIGGMGHMSAFVQDDDGIWYFFYWGNESVSLTKVDEPTILKDENKINEWLEEQGLSDGKYKYDGFCYILGDFSKSKDYYQKLTEQYNTDIQNGDYGWFGWDNKNYNFVTRNCTQETMNGLYLGKIGINGEKSVKKIHNESGYCIAVVPNSNLYNLQKVYGSKTLNWWE